MGVTDSVHQGHIRSADVPMRLGNSKRKLQGMAKLIGHVEEGVFYHRD